jgi:hypothetical protein
VLIEQQAESFHVTFFQRRFYLISQLLGAMQAVDHFVVVFLGVGILPLQDVGTGAMLAGIEKQNRIPQILASPDGQIYGCHTDLSVACDLEDRDAAELR